MSSCLDEETILAFAEGKVTADVRARAQDHIAECDECRALVSAVARASRTKIDERARSLEDVAMAPTTPASAPSGPISAPVRPGEVLAGKYEIERVLGAGGMGVVVAARHTQLEKHVALKFLLPAGCEVPGAVKRFMREGQAAARITSEHCARVLDVGVLDGGAPYLVMEYLEGGDLGALVKARGKLPWSEAVEYVLQACEAIAEAHELGIVHRDLKPANLFLTHRADGSPLVKVLDFGISKVEGGSRSQLTSASMLMGSPRYMSPEQMLSAKDVDARSDVWALGVILFELVTGRPVWESDTVQGLCAEIASSPAPLLRTFAPEVPVVLENVVARCLAKRREERMSSVGDLALALAPIAPPSAKTSIERIARVAKKSAPSRPPAAISQAPSPPPARRLVIGLAAGVSGLLVVGIALNAALPPRPTPAAASTAVQEPTPTQPTVVASPSAPTNGAATATPPTAVASPSAPANGAATAAVEPALASAPTPGHAAPRATAARHAASPPIPPTATQTSAPAPPVDTSKPAADPGRALTDRK